MAEYSATAVQVVNPGESIIFTESPAPCRSGLIRHRDGTGVFLLSGWIPRQFGYWCRCGRRRQNSAIYFVDFGANIAVPEGQTVPEDGISVAVTIDGATIPASTMIVTPAAVEQYFNVSRAINAQIFSGCCQTATIRNTSAIPINVGQANLNFDRPDLAVTR